MPGQQGPPIRGSNPYGPPDVINSIEDFPWPPPPRQRPPRRALPPPRQRPISSIYMSYPGGQQGPGQGPALEGEPNQFALMRDDPTRNFAYLMETLGKYMV